MKERLLTLAFAAGALLVFYAVMAPKPTVRDPTLSRPTSAESRANGYLAARRWLESTGIRVASLRERFDTLTAKPREGRPPFTATGNLLITSLPHRFQARHREINELRKWVRAGNSLLVMASLGDTPDWSMPPERSVVSELHGLSGLFAQSHDAPLPEGKTREQMQADQAATAFQPLDPPERIELVPAGNHPLFAGVQRLLAESEYPADDFYIAAPYDGFLFTLARERYSSGEAFWVRPAGGGAVLVSAYASLFTNQMLGEEGNARLLSNLVSWAVRPGGTVIFDDMHQGLSALYHPESFFGDSRLLHTIWLLLALWLIWVLGGTRLRVLQAPVAAPGEGALVRATGGFLARVLKPAQAAGRLFQLFFDDLRRRLGEPQDGQPLWGWLERRGHLDATDLAALRQFHARAGAGRRVDLRKLQALMLRIQEQVRT